MRSYSFVNNHTCIPPDSFFYHLQSTEAGMTATSRTLLSACLSPPNITSFVGAFNFLPFELKLNAFMHLASAENTFISSWEVIL